MAIRPLAVIIDQFSDRIFYDIEYDNLTLYDYGFLHEVTFFDHVVNPKTGVRTELNTYDYYEFTRTDTQGGFYEFSYDEYSTEDEDFTFISSEEFTDAYYNTAYADKFDYFVRTDEKSHASVGHGDWALNSFIDQLDGTDTHIIVIDVDELNNKSSGIFEHGDAEAHWTKLFDAVQTNMQGAAGTIPALIDIVENFYLSNDARFTGNASDDTYLPVILSASIAGAPASSDQINTFGYIENQRSLIVQAAPNTSQGDYDWGSNYPDVINVGAWNETTDGYTLISSANTFDTIDIVGNGYVQRPGWENGATFGTSFATPRVSAEVTNLFKTFIDDANSKGLSIDNLDLSSINYSTLVAAVENDITTDILVTWENPGGSTFDSVLNLMTDDLNNFGLSPVQVPTSSGLATKVKDVKLISSAPQFTSSTTSSVNENISTSAAAYTAIATDADGDALSYSISGTDTSYLNINAQTGAVTFKSSPNYETKTSYQFDVTTSDGANSATQTITISITDQNDAAEFRNIFLTGAPHEVGDTVTAYYEYLDEDGATSASPAVNWYAKTGDNYTFRETSGDTYTIAATDAGSEIAFSISFQDDKGYSEQSPNYFLENTIVQQGNQSPVFTSSTSADVKENISPETTIYTAAASDADGDDISYSIVGTDKDDFSIGSASGALKFNTSPNFEVKNKYEVELVAFDGIASTNQKITINITDRNDPATFSLLESPRILTAGSNISVSFDYSDEDGSSGDLYHFWYLDDDDPSTSATYLNGYLSTDGSIKLDKSWGGQNLLVSASFFDDAGNTEYSSSYDLGEIQALTNNAPEITSARAVNIFENTATAAAAYQIQATDLDDESLTYSLSGLDASAFTINTETGHLYFLTSPDFERKSTYSVTV